LIHARRKNKTNIGDLMAGIKRKDIVLPEFQREFVWSLEQSKQLMVSLIRKYPTGSLLFWKTEKPPEIKMKSPLLCRKGH
jgi:uncharacterized protein with ParB-like and HNH nuclease domain